MTEGIGKLAGQPSTGEADSLECDPPAHTRAGDFGALLFECRSRLRWSQASAARAAGISAGYLSELENRKRTPPPAATVRRIAAALRLAPAESSALLDAAQAERGSMDSGVCVSPCVLDLLCDIVRASPRLNTEVVRQLQHTLRAADG